MSFLRLECLEKRYRDGFLAVKGLDLTIERGEFVVLLGPSGCGKTTTLRCVAGLELATGGRIILDGDEVTARRPAQRDVGMVFQFYALYPHLSVRENIRFPLRSVGMAAAERERRVNEVAERLNLGALLDRSPRQLSGGDQQRVSLARAMVRQPKVWLMDEPLGQLDAHQREALRDFIRERQQEAGVTTLYVTHDQEEAMSLADRMVVMDGGEIRQVGTPEDVYERPADRFIADFVGSPGMNQLVDAQGPFGIRPEYVHLDDGAPLRGTVLMDEYLGGWRNLHCETPAGRVIARTHPEQRQPVGANVGLRLDPAHRIVFATASASPVTTEAPRIAITSSPHGLDVSVSALVKRFGSRTALSEVSLSVGADELLVVLGPTGAGKTTLLRLLAGLETPDSGSIRFGDREATSLSPADRDVALVFQNFSLYPEWSVRDNIAFPLRAPSRRTPAAEIARRVAWAAQVLRLEPYLDRPASRLSGGQMQRVAIGRAIVRQPRLFLFDEPLTNLDAKLREQLRVELAVLRRELKTPMIYVTHDQAEALAMGDRIVVLDQGRVLQTGTPEMIYHQPTSPVVAAQLGQPAINLLRVERRDGWWTTAAGMRVLLIAEGDPTGAAILGVRPEHVASDGGATPSTVTVVEHLGPLLVVVVAIPGGELRLVLGKDRSCRRGDILHPRVDRAHIHVWPE